MTGRSEHDFDPDATMQLRAVGGNELDGSRTIGFDVQTAELPTVPATPGFAVDPSPAGSGPTAATPAGTVPGDDPAAPPGGTVTEQTSVARNSATMAVWSLVSRATGFLRTAAISAAIGAEMVGNAYNIANTLPGMIYELLLGGVLASVVVPLLVRARTTDPDRGEAYAQRLLTLAVVFLAGATLATLAAAPLLTRLVANPRTTAANTELITTLSYLILPVIFFYGLAALCAAVLNTRGHFAAPTWTPILNNLVVIVTAGVFVLLPGGDLAAAELTAAQVAVLGLGTTLGIVVQAVGLLPALRRVGFRWRWRWDFRKLHLSELARVGGWMLAYVAISQVGVLVILKIAQLAADQGGPGPAIYLNAFLIFMMAHGIVAVSIITALMPRMSTAAAERRYTDVAAHLSHGTRLSAVILVPATAAYLVLGRPMGITLFGYGNYGHDNAVSVGWVIAAAGLSLVPFAISQLQIFAFYALPDTKTPALVNIPSVAVRIGVDVLLYVVLPVAWVAAGRMIGNAVSFLVTSVIGYWLLRRRLGPLDLRRVGATLARLAAAAAVAAVPAGLVVMVGQRLLGDSWGASLVQLLVGGAVLIVVYVAAALVLRVGEVRDLVSTVRGRLGR
jgi:putative peptidoglycan lipid II flippase